MAEELEKACGEAGCANGINDSLGGGTGGILQIGSYVDRRDVEGRGFWFGEYARHVVLWSCVILCDIIFRDKKDRGLLEV